MVLNLQDAGEIALVFGIEVNDDHEGCAGLIRQRLKKLLQRVDTARRCADTDDGRTRPLGLRRLALVSLFKISHYWPRRRRAYRAALGVTIQSDLAGIWPSSHRTSGSATLNRRQPHIYRGGKKS